VRVRPDIISDALLVTSAVYTPKDFRFDQIIDMVTLAERHRQRR